MKRAIIITSILLSQSAFAGLIPEKEKNITNLENVATKCNEENQNSCINKLKEKIEKHENKTYNVLVVPLDSSYSENSAKTATNALKSVLVKNKIKIVDRNISQSLRDELITLEQGGRSKGILYDYADYAIKGEVLEVATERLFKNSRKDCDAIGTDCTIRCQVKVDTTIRISLFNMSPLTVIDDVNISKSVQETHKDVTEESCKDKDIAQDIRRSIKENFEDNSRYIINSFVSDGVITAHRKEKKKHYFRTQLKKSNKYKSGQKVEIIRYVTNVDPVLGKTTEAKILGKGKIAKTAGDDFVWVRLAKKSNAEDILLSDTVKIHTSKCSGPLDYKCLKDKVSRISGVLSN